MYPISRACCTCTSFHADTLTGTSCARTHMETDSTVYRALKPKSLESMVNHPNLFSENLHSRLVVWTMIRRELPKTNGYEYSAEVSTVFYRYRISLSFLDSRLEHVSNHALLRLLFVDLCAFVEHISTCELEGGLERATPTTDTLRYWRHCQPLRHRERRCLACIFRRAIVRCGAVSPRRRRERRN